MSRPTPCLPVMTPSDTTAIIATQILSYNNETLLPDTHKLTHITLCAPHSSTAIHHYLPSAHPAYCYSMALKRSKRGIPSATLQHVSDDDEDTIMTDSFTLSEYGTTTVTPLATPAKGTKRKVQSSSRSTNSTADPASSPVRKLRRVVRGRLGAFMSVLDDDVKFEVCAMEPLLAW